MNILLCADISKTNQYIELLKKAYEQQGHFVMLGFNSFINPSKKPDFVHIQWPEFFYKLNNELVNVEKIIKIIDNRLQYFKKNKIPIVYTVHNLLPHDSKKLVDERFFRLIIKNVDIFVHHGKKSIKLIQQKYPFSKKKKHIVAPHGDYPVDIRSKKESKLRYGLPLNKCVFLNFGKQRPYKNENFIKRVFSQNDLNTYLFIIGPKEYVSSNIVLKYLFLVRSKILDPFYAKIISVFSKDKKIILRRVSNEEIPCIFSAVNAVFIGHNKGLNSGLLSLAASYKIPVVYPEIGNFSEQLNGWIWKESYEVNNIVSARKAVIRLQKKLKGIGGGDSIYDNSTWLNLHTWELHISEIIESVNSLI